MDHAAVIDIRTPLEICRNLEKTGLRLLKVPCCSMVAEPICGHPDIQLFINERKAFVNPYIDMRFLRELERFCEINICSTPLSPGYPGDIPYNIACTGMFAIHKPGHTEPAIMDHLDEVGITFINTNQGYAKCSTLIINKKCIITADRSIAESSQMAGMDSLLISPGHVDLPGYSYGFIGGAAARFMDSILFTGSIDEHPDRESIHEFIESRGLKVKVLSGERVLDTGSILVIR